MKKSFLTAGIIVLVLTTLIIIGSFILNPIIEKRINSTIQNNLTELYSLNDFKINVNLLKRYVIIEDFRLEPKRETDSIEILNFEFEKATFTGISYLKLLFSKKINFNQVFLSEMHLELQSTESNGKNTNPHQLNRVIEVNQFVIENSIISKVSAENHDPLEFHIVEFKLSNLKVNNELLSQKIPFEFEAIEGSISGLKYQLNDFDLLKFEELMIQNENITISNFSIKTKYSRDELSQNIQKERDHFDLFISTIDLKEYAISERQDSILFSLKKAAIKNTDFKVYRDKLVTDNPSIKPLYSKSLRELPLLLSVDTVLIENTAIVYEEKIHSKRAPGVIQFSELNAEIVDFSNTYSLGEKKTTIDISTNFMRETPLTISWNFDVQSTKDVFQIQGEIGNLQASKMNAFTVSNLNMETEGELLKTYFNINGNNHQSTIDFRINYENFKVDLLNNEQKINKFLSTVANVFVKKNTDSKDDAFKEVQAQVERKRDKSVFNYLWINIEAGLKKVMLKI
ncbi:hypothetical protein [uncultured Planktosalinus sp.]|uniref:hypothetical protein n=1 Tax=uncultured Planktosalinus sp. TaxID=1810935 RepID=UPI0030D8787D